MQNYIRIEKSDELWWQEVTPRVIYDRVRNRKNYFEIAAFLNFELGTSRVVNSNENTNTNKHISVAAKCNITLNFPLLIFLNQ